VGSARQRERGGAERLRARESGPAMGQKGGEARARGGGAAAAAWAGSSPARGERVFSFTFLFSNSYFHFCIFSF
jgi:hypothetical protein